MSQQTYEFEGESYQRTTDGWINAKTYTKPPLVVSQVLDRLHGPVTRTSPGVSATPRVKTPKPAGRDFTGLVASDFKMNVTGTHWRAKSGLGGLLAQALSDRSGRTFLHHAVYRRPEVLFGEPPRFDRQNQGEMNLRVAKFFIYLDSEVASYGFYVEKPHYLMTPEWEWPAFVQAMADDALVSEVDAAMREHNLRWRIVESDGETQAIHQQITISTANPLDRSSLSGLTDAGERTYWYDLFLKAQMPREEAVAAGVGIVEPITDVYMALLPLYNACA